MQCKEVQLELAAYLAGELPAEKMAAVKTHLSQCKACAEEAAFMDPLNRRLSEGLKLWVDQGTCPPDVMARIEESLRRDRRSAKWVKPAASLAVAAVAAVFVIALAGAWAELPPGQLASLPLVGSIAAQLLSNGSGDMETGGAQAAAVNRVTQSGGVTLTVQRMLTSSESTTIQYTVNPGGKGVQPELRGPQGPIPFRRMTTRMSRGQLVVTAEFDPVPSGQEVTLTVQDLSVALETP